jgi:hypothetical protein
MWTQTTCETNWHSCHTNSIMGQKIQYAANSPVSAVSYAPRTAKTARVFDHRQNPWRSVTSPLSCRTLIATCRHNQARSMTYGLQIEHATEACSKPRGFRSRPSKRSTGCPFFRGLTHALNVWRAPVRSPQYGGLREPSPGPRGVVSDDQPTRAPSAVWGRQRIGKH